MTLTLLSTSACYLSVPPPPEWSTRTPFPLTTSTPVVDTVFDEQATVTQAPVPTEKPAIFLSPTSIPTPTMAVTTVDILVGLNIDCPTPKSLMLHSAYGTTRMQELADNIVARGWVTGTYRDLQEILLQGECPPEDMVIVTLDDIGVAFLRAVFKPMIQIFLDKGLILVAGVNTQQSQNLKNWDYLRDIYAQGIEISSHSANHYELSPLSVEEMRMQIIGSYNAICEEIGECPVTLILPYGSGGDDEIVQFYAKNYTFLIGVAGYHDFGGRTPFVLGRIPPDNDSQAFTLTLLENSFSR